LSEIFGWGWGGGLSADTTEENANPILQKPVYFDRGTFCRGMIVLKSIFSTRYINSGQKNDTKVKLTFSKEYYIKPILKST